MSSSYRCYEQLNFVDDMKDLESCELKPLDAINSSGLWMILMILGCEPMALNAMNSLGMWIT